MEQIFELALVLPPEGSRTRLRALHRQLRDAILDGRLRPELRLPSSRRLAATLKLSRNTVVDVYDLLLSEGYLVARPGSGVYVAEIRRRAPSGPAPTGPDPRLAAGWRHEPPRLRPLMGQAQPFDFRMGLPETRAFPFEIWRRLSARVLRAQDHAPATYLDPQGQPALREAIARHVSFNRAVACTPDDILVTGGAQQAFDLLARVLVTPGETVVAMEEPGFTPMRQVFAAAGARVRPIPLDEEGLRVELLPRDARIICVTPSHQFPLGMAMSPRRRGELLAFAHARGALVIEDDYDGEFRFGGRPLDALQTLDDGACAFYVGTFSKSLFPALRLGFLVAPAWAKAALVAAKQLSDCHCPALTQDTLAAFISEGGLARHVRRMRKIYGERRAVLLDALARLAPERLRPLPTVAGLHLAAMLETGLEAEGIVARAAAVGVGLSPLSRFAATPPGVNGLGLGYGLIGADQIEAGVQRLIAVLDTP